MWAISLPSPASASPMNMDIRYSLVARTGKPFAKGISMGERGATVFEAPWVRIPILTAPFGNRTPIGQDRNPDPRFGERTCRNTRQPSTFRSCVGQDSNPDRTAGSAITIGQDRNPDPRFGE